MTFTSTPPTKPGFYAHRYKPEGELALFILNVEDIAKGRGPSLGEWHRLVPAEEVGKAYREGWALEDYIDTEDAWPHSRAKRVMEGEI